MIWSTVAMPRLRPLTLAASIVACGPGAPMSPDASTTDASSESTASPTTAPATSSTTSSSTTTGSPSSSTSLDSTSSSTTAVDPSTSTSDPSDAQTFIQPSDFSCLAVRGHNSPRCSECDTFQQDCPPGEKCTSYANDGGGSWNAHKCTSVAPDPDQVGEPCTVEGGSTTGVDSCDLGSMCWFVDENTLMGTCVAFCTGSPNAPICPADTSCINSNDGELALCLPTCDPLLQDCAQGLCIGNSTGNNFVCVFDGSGAEGQLFDPCQFLNACDPGLACLNPEAASECDPNEPGCCLPFCDLSLPPGCPGAMQVCTPWFGMDVPPPEYMNVGFCSVPM
jgi:hypothetical protein